MQNHLVLIIFCELAFLAVHGAVEVIRGARGGGQRADEVTGDSEGAGRRKGIVVCTLSIARGRAQGNGQPELPGSQAKEGGFQGSVS